MMQSFHQEFWENPDPPTVATPFEATLRRHASVPSSTFANVTLRAHGSVGWDLRVGRFILRSAGSTPSTGDRTTPNRFDRVTGISSGNVREMGGLKLDRITAKAVFNRYQSAWLGAEPRTQGRHPARTRRTSRTDRDPQWCAVPGQQRRPVPGGLPRAVDRRRAGRTWCRSSRAIPSR